MRQSNHHQATSEDSDVTAVIQSAAAEALERQAGQGRTDQPAQAQCTRQRRRLAGIQEHWLSSPVSWHHTYCRMHTA